MKRIIMLLLVLCIVFSLSACGSTVQKETNESKVEENSNNTNKYSIVVTTFPIYDWVKELTGNESVFDITILQDNGADLHNYQPTIEDMVAITQSDLFIYVGGESDDWVEEIEYQNKINALNLMDALQKDILLEEVEKEGMTIKEEGEDTEDAEEVEIDEHIWLSLRNAKVLCESIKSALIELAPEMESAIDNNCLFYTNQMIDLDKKYTELLKANAGNVLIFADRFPFAYLLNDYNLDYYAAFKGCSAETEASFETVAFLSDKLKELNSKNIFVIEGNDHRIAETLIKNSDSINIEIIELNSMQNITSKDIKTGVHYIDIMKSDLDVLVSALSR